MCSNVCRVLLVEVLNEDYDYTINNLFYLRTFLYTFKL